MAVVGEEKRARAFQSLLGDNGLVCLQIKLRAHRPVRPDNADDICALLIAQAEVNERACDELLLNEQAGANLHLAADAERVDALIACGLCCARAYLLPVIVFRASTD